MSAADLAATRGLRVGEFVNREVHTGSGSHWVRLTRERDGWRATWDQGGERQEVAYRGGIEATLVEVRLRARQIEIAPADDTEPVLPDDEDPS